jgi:Ca2+-binding EF-hand superfamily protein
MKTLVAALALIVLASTAALAAKDPAARADQILARLDADHDGRISPAEAQPRPRMAKHFARVDANHDGYITRDELAAAIARRQQKKGG